MRNKEGLGIQCYACGDKIFSLSRHDYKYCKCGKCFVDGGFDYLRYGGEDFKQILIVDKEGNIKKSDCLDTSKDILAIDPGTNHLGLAFFKAGKLMQTNTISTKEKERYERTLDICGQLMNTIDNTPGGFDYNSKEMIVACEEPMLQGRANTAMQRMIGAIEFLMAPKMHYIHPMTMKKIIGAKTSAKEDVKTAVLNLISDNEIVRHESLFLSQRYDEIDAVGVGLAYLIQKGYLTHATEKRKIKKSKSGKHR